MADFIIQEPENISALAIAMINRETIIWNIERVVGLIDRERGLVLFVAGIVLVLGSSVVCARVFVSYKSDMFWDDREV